MIYIKPDARTTNTSNKKEILTSINLILNNIYIILKTKILKKNISKRKIS